MKTHTILFVDDDPLILKGLNRSLEEYLEFWNAYFVISGKEALQKLAEIRFDAIITDMQMPVMDGLTLLKEVSQAYPGVLRFILSGNANDLQTIKSIDFVHQMFPKPSEMDSIFQEVERACRLKDSLSNPALIQTITSIKSLPSQTTLFNQLLNEFQNAEPNLKNIGEIVAKDTAMTAKVLQLVNSAFFGLSDKVRSPQRAVTILGINTTKALTLSSNIYSEFENQSNVPNVIKKFWNHSILVSSIAHNLALDLRLTFQEQEDAQVSGILHDIGKLIEYKIPTFSRTAMFMKDPISVESEYEVLGTSHAEMGAYLLGIWGLPTSIVEVVMYHHFPSRQISNKCNAITVVHLANGLLNMCQNEGKKNYEKYLDMEYLKQVIEIEQLDKWTESITNVINNQRNIL